MHWPTSSAPAARHRLRPASTGSLCPRCAAPLPAQACHRGLLAAPLRRLRHNRAVNRRAKGLRRWCIYGLGHGPCLPVTATLAARRLREHALRARPGFVLPLDDALFCAPLCVVGRFPPGVAGHPVAFGAEPLRAGRRRIKPPRPCVGKAVDEGVSCAAAGAHVQRYARRAALHHQRG